MIMSGVALLAKNPVPTDAEIIRFMDGNVCRCGGYSRILTALKLAARALSTQADEASRKV
jgi:aerobic-type carbon monoxide dehydrogenase small subunit (CoxS/CutS family)